MSEAATDKRGTAAPTSAGSCAWGLAFASFGLSRTQGVGSILFGCLGSLEDICAYKCCVGVWGDSRKL